MSSLTERLRIKAQLSALKLASKVLPSPRPLVLLGPGSAQRFCRTLRDLGVRHPLVVTDGVLYELGVLDPILRRLRREKLAVTVYQGVTPDPTERVVNEGVALLKHAGCDAVLAIGGGSSIDAGKVIALAAANDCPAKKLVGVLKAHRAALPLFVVPTTAGTGSEVTVGAVISDDHSHKKGLVIDPKLVPRATALDPRLMRGMPPKVTAETGVDALTHAIEAWISDFATPETDQFAGAATRLVFQNLPRAFADGEDLEAREAMALAAHYAGLAINQTGVGYVHAIAHQLGALYRVPHGRANAIVLPHVLGFNRQSCNRRFAALARTAELVADATDEQATARLFEAVEHLLGQLAIDRHVTGLSAEEFADIVRAAFAEAHGTYAVPRYMAQADGQRILKAIAAE
ncbi:iron-containing alcohol dehydrogenase [Marinobacteraceae bacterium S3BR75-40.1]